MGPIMLMGFSLTILDASAMRRAIFTMACGVVAAITISFLIVRLSPLTEITPEIHCPYTAQFLRPPRRHLLGASPAAMR